MARGYEYQKQLWNSYVARGRGRLFLAKFEGKVIGGLICIMFGRKCVAMHMGTPYKYQKLQSYYAYVWESIRWAKENGCEWYSFRGVGTTPTQEAFKRKFNPTVVALAGYFDFPFRPWLYRLFHWCEFTLLPASWPLLVGTRKLATTALRILTGQSAA
jgi:lipid II:glycine glycyltransferase (peptidoglycan interpeptide bridge formation enzyme)